MEIGRTTEERKWHCTAAAVGMEKKECRKEGREKQEGINIKIWRE